MKCITVLSVVVLVVIINLSSSQVPQRLQIPGALLLQQARPRARIQRPQQQQQFDPSQLPRIRRPIQNAIPVPLPQPIREPVRPVVEEVDDHTETSIFDNEVAKLSLSSAQSISQEEIEEEQPRPVAFRPERPVPLLRSDIRDAPRPVARPAPIPIPNARLVPISNPRPAPVQNTRPVQVSNPRPAPVQRPARPILRQELEEENIPIRKPVQQVRQPARQAPRIAPRPYDDDDDRPQRRKPPVQILRKYRTDNEDGSITWGFENEDETFKEETLGADCITRGKYGYIDPDGVRREYSYETGSKCKEEEEELPEDLPVRNISPNKLPRKPF